MTKIPDECPNPWRECPAQEIALELTQLASALKLHATSMEGVIERVENVVEKMDKTIFGNGTPGLLVRMDRIEQSEIRREKLQAMLRNVAFGSAAALIVQTLLFLAGLIYTIHNHMNGTGP